MHNHLIAERPLVNQGNGSRPPLAAEQLDALRRLDTCTIANAIEQFGIRLRNEGYTQPGLRCLTPNAGVLGYAATCKVKSAEPPITGQLFMDRTDWWNAIQALPLPRIAVVQDIDPHPSSGASVGEVHSAILKALGCEGIITNGAVRDLPAVSKMGFAVFAADLAVSHSYVHIVEFGTPVEICGLAIHSGDLLCADCHGVISIPLEIAAEIPAVARRILAQERRIIGVCLSPDFSAGKLLDAIRSNQDGTE
jgi:4-hydroxy-4-methyl-2-oxoglutarate aldolase